MVGLFVGLLYAFKFADSKKNDVENNYNNDDDDY